MPTYTVQRPRLRHDGEEYTEGETVEMPEEQAARKLHLGALEETAEGGPGEPSEDLQELVGPKQASALADAGLPTIEEALAYEGDLTSLDGVGDATADDIAAFAE